MLPLGHVDEVYLLDLCTLAYQLHSQALIFNFDPYAEQIKLEKGKGEYRLDFFRNLTNRISDPQTSAPLRNRNLRGPEDLTGRTNAGWNLNIRLAPVLYDWSQISPRRPGLSRQNKEGEGVLIYAAPSAITERISQWHTATYDGQQSPPRGKLPFPNAAKVTVSPGRTNPSATGTDWLYIFEGATGVDKNGCGHWGPMGYVLTQDDPSGDYDLFVVFRGSRSGELRFGKSLKSIDAADWVTDLDMAKQHFDPISPGAIHHGFGRCFLSMAPAIVECLKSVHAAKNKPPRHIFISGHSLGGALATCLISSLLTGDPALWNNLPAPVKPDPFSNAAWPWFEATVAVFAAPPVGGKKFRRNFDRACNNFVNYMLAMDVVGGSRFMHVGRTEVFETYNNLMSPGRAHSPDVIRRRLQLRFRTSAQQQVRTMLQRDNQEPFKAFDAPSEAFNAFAAALPAATNLNRTTRKPRNNADNLALYLETLRKCIDSDEIPSEDKQRDLTTLSTAIADLQTQPTAAQLEAIFRDLKGMTICEYTERGLGLQRMFQAWIWMACVELGGWGEVARLLNEIGQTNRPWVTETGPP